MPASAKMTLAERVEEVEHGYERWEGLERLLGQYMPRLDARTRHEIAAVLLTSCGFCWSDDPGCQCWNDE